ncbi:unnamed protein product [Notodromas monacha]|uniref:Ubiquitin carboxyl-terminal hydrolase n=1 Tax=Notodromas monacha TaxID=399045 RepID=A0A7R9BBU5_9CRUS|nr:unnamed protein product [Notodromas monacha]CAG0912375.1 unnamed protein product [Notodromas monacha]
MTMYRAPDSCCPHVTRSVGDVGQLVLNEQTLELLKCGVCGRSEKALWLCLYPMCFAVGCGKKGDDHSSAHYLENELHCVQLSLSTWRLWCHACDSEVFSTSNDPPLAFPVPCKSRKRQKRDSVVPSTAAKKCEQVSEHGITSSSSSVSWDSGISSGHRSLKVPLWPVGAAPATEDVMAYDFFETEDWSEDDDKDDGTPMLFPQMGLQRKLGPRRGLVGFANLGNTCYLNAALQTLCHVQPLVDFFIHCRKNLSMAAEERLNAPSVGRSGGRNVGFEHTGAGDERMTSNDPQIALAFRKILDSMYENVTVDYVAPWGVLRGIRMVNPTFRGYHQQDSQEFMRCFMDQLHEETKYLVIRDARGFQDFVEAAAENGGAGDETCDAVSEEEAYEDVQERESTKSDDEPEVNGDDERGYETCDSGLSNSTSSEESPNHGMAERTRSARKKQRYPSIHLPSSPTDGDFHSGRHARFGELPAGSVPEGNPQGYERRRARPCSKPRYRQADADDASEHRATINKSYKSVVSSVFDGKLISSVQCLTCAQVSSTLETFQDLSLPIPGGESLQRLRSAGSKTSMSTSSLGPMCESAAFSSTVPLSDQLDARASVPGWISWFCGWLKSWLWGPTVSLHDCLAAFFSADELKGDNMYSCNTCKKLRNGMKVSRVLELPEVMCIHLKRFRHEYLGSSKISTRVSFPLECIDMGPYLHKDCKSRVTKYRLVGVICHIGNSLGGGHYVSYCSTAARKWFEFDDRIVTRVTPEIVANTEAYVLLYQKDDPMAWLKRERILQEFSRSLNDMDFMHYYVSKEWLVRFNTCSEPGPIDNSDFLCPHGSVWPHRAAFVQELCVEIPQNVWEELHKSFGGGTACNRLQICRVCEDWQEKIFTRQAAELQRYQELYEEFQECDSSVYAISLPWFRQWQAFVKGRMFDIPGAIDNKQISKTVAGRQKSQLRHSFKSDFVEVSEDMWNWFRNVYGGGPAVLLKEIRKESIASGFPKGF